MYKNILPYIEQLIKDFGLEFIFIDIGSRNGIQELGDIAQYTNAFGFEPNPSEYQKLIEGNTDAEVRFHLKPLKYKLLQYFPYALGNKDGKTDFFVTPGPAVCGLLEPNLNFLKEIAWKGRKYKKNFGEDIFAGYKKIEVEAIRLDSFLKKQKISNIDYLKIDVEGSEYEVLEGAGEFLSKTGVIKTEVCFAEFRKSQKLFSDVDIFLRKFGFQLLRYEISPEQVGYKCRIKPFQYKPSPYPDPYGQPLQGEAIYVNQNLSNKERALATAVILLEKNYIDEALYLLTKKLAINNAPLIELLNKDCVYGQTMGQKIRAFGYFLADSIVDSVKNILSKP